MCCKINDYVLTNDNKIVLITNVVKDICGDYTYHGIGVDDGISCILSLKDIQCIY